MIEPAPWVAQVWNGPTRQQIAAWPRKIARRRAASAAAHRDRCTLIAAENVTMATRYQREIDAIDSIHPPTKDDKR